MIEIKKTVLTEAWTTNTISSGDRFVQLGVARKRIANRHAGDGLKRIDEINGIVYYLELEGDSRLLIATNFYTKNPDLKEEVVGVLELTFDEPEFSFPAVNASVVIKSHLGKGIGKQMHKIALDQFGAIDSDTSLSRPASMLWKSMIESFGNGCLVIPRGNSPTKKEIEVTIHGWTTDNGYAYPVLKGTAGREFGLNEILSKEPTLPGSRAARLSRYRIKE